MLYSRVHYPNVYCKSTPGIYDVSFEKLFYQSEQDGFDAETKKIRTLTDLLHILLCELGRLVSENDFNCKDNIAEMVKMCNDYPELGGHAHILCIVCQLGFWAKAFYVSAESVTLHGSNGGNGKGEESISNQKKRLFLYWENNHTSTRIRDEEVFIKSALRSTHGIVS